MTISDNTRLPIVNDTRRRLLADGERVARVYVHYVKAGDQVPHDEVENDGR
jgi:hypothetical protein